MHGIRILLFSLAIIVTAASAVQAQSYATDRGSFILGGSTGLSSHRSVQQYDGQRHDYRFTYVYMAPRVQYFVRPGLALGGSLDLAHSRNRDDSATSYGVGPAIAFFFGEGERTLYPYVSAQTSYLRVSGRDTRQLGYGLAGGMLYMLTRTVGLDGSLFFRGSSVTGLEEDQRVRDSVFGLAVGFSAFAF
jgi:hypothetical protein